jgi:hypothetical protein
MLPFERMLVLRIAQISGKMRAFLWQETLEIRIFQCTCIRLGAIILALGLL